MNFTFRKNNITIGLKFPTPPFADNAALNSWKQSISFGRNDYVKVATKKTDANGNEYFFIQQAERVLVNGLSVLSYKNYVQLHFCKTAYLKVNHQLRINSPAG